MYLFSVFRQEYVPHAYLTKRSRDWATGTQAQRKPSLLKDSMISSDPDSAVFAWPWVFVCVRLEHINTRPEPKSRVDTTRHLKRLSTQVDAVCFSFWCSRKVLQSIRHTLCHLFWCCSFDSGKIAADSMKMVLISRERVAVDCTGNRGI